MAKTLTAIQQIALHDIGASLTAIAIHLHSGFGPQADYREMAGRLDECGEATCMNLAKAMRALVEIHREDEP